MTANILYPIARDNTGRLVPIEEAARATGYTCLGCCAPMVPRLGAQRQSHYAHKVSNSQCSPESMLHQLAKRLIADGINTASRGGTPYNVEVLCAQHPGGVLTTINLAPPGTAAEEIANTERSAAPGTVADILVDRPNEPRLAIEVVVTHDLDTTKTARYAEQDIDWIRVKLGRTPADPLAQLIELSAGLEVDRLDVRTTPACPQCPAQVNNAYNDTGGPAPHAGPQPQPASRNLMTQYVADHHAPELPRTLQIRRAYVEIQPGDCIIGIFTGVDIPGAGHTPAGAGPRWNFEDPATGVGVCVRIWPTRLNPDAYRSMIGRLCILTCRQEGINQSTGNRRFHFNLAQWPSGAAVSCPYRA